MRSFSVNCRANKICNLQSNEHQVEVGRDSYLIKLLSELHLQLSV